MLTKIQVEKIQQVFLWSKAAVRLHRQVSTHVLFSWAWGNQTLTQHLCRQKVSDLAPAPIL